MIKLKYCIVGTGRCGSVFVARLLTSLGVTCGHECCFDWNGYDLANKRLKGEESLQTSDTSLKERYEDSTIKIIPKWLDEDKIVAESSYMASPFIDSELLQDTKFIHIIRNPIKVVNSFVNYLNYFKYNVPNPSNYTIKKYERFIFRHCPDVGSGLNPYERAAIYVMKWNQMIENKLSKKENYLFHRIEDPIDNLLNFIGKEKTEEMFNETKANTFKKKNTSKFKIDEIKREKIKNEFIEFCEKYNYKTSEDEIPMI